MTSLSTNALSVDLTTPPIQNIEQAENEKLLAPYRSNPNILNLIHVYAGDPRLKDMNQGCYRQIFEVYDKTGNLHSRMIVDLKELSQVSSEQAVMNLFNWASNAALDSTISPYVAIACKNGAAPLSLPRIVDEAQSKLDRSTIIFFKRLGNKLPGSSDFLRSISHLSEHEQAIKIRSALKLQQNRPLLEQITELDLSGTALTYRPSEVPIGIFNSWEKLDTHQNLTVLPPEIELFPNLTTLNLSGNRLTAIPKIKLPKLEKLVLQNNQLVEAPTIQQFPNLVQLDLSKNRLTTVHYKDTENLCFVDLSSNKITNVHFENVPRLQKLDLHENQLTKEPDCLGYLCCKCPHQCRIDLKQNPIKPSGTTV